MNMSGCAGALMCEGEIRKVEESPQIRDTKIGSNGRGRVRNFEFCLDHQFTRQFPDKIVCLVKRGKL